MNYNLFPSMRAIQLYERFTNESFLKLEQNPDNILIFIYCVLVAHPENDFRMTFTTACAQFFPKHANELVSKFAGEMEFINQFKRTSDEADSSTNEEETSSPKEEETLFLSSMIPILINECGLDTKYVLDEFPYTELETYVNYKVERDRERMEEQRFWTYLTIAPHIDGKKIKGPEDLFEFTWEKDKKKTAAENKLQADRARLVELGIIKESKD